MIQDGARGGDRFEYISLGGLSNRAALRGQDSGLEGSSHGHSDSLPPRVVVVVVVLFPPPELTSFLPSFSESNEKEGGGETKVSPPRKGWAYNRYN